MIVIEMVRINTAYKNSSKIIVEYNNFDKKCPVIGKFPIKNYRMKGVMNFNDKNKYLSWNTAHLPSMVLVL